MLGSVPGFLRASLWQSLGRPFPGRSSGCLPRSGLALVPAIMFFAAFFPPRLSIAMGLENIINQYSPLPWLSTRLPSTSCRRADRNGSSALPSPFVQLPLKHPDLNRCFQAHPGFGKPEGGSRQDAAHKTGNLGQRASFRRAGTVTGPSSGGVGSFCIVLASRSCSTSAVEPQQ